MKKKPATRQLPFQHTLYDRLQATEGRLDHLLIRKRLDVQEAISRSMRTKQVLRLFFSNTCYDDSANTGTKQWTLKIEARVLGSPHSAKKMSHYLKQIVIQLADAAAAAAVPAVANNNNDAAMDTSDTQDSTQTITWHKSPAAPASDGFEIKRSTTTHQQSIQARILITPDYVPERFHLSDALSALLNLQDETKPNVILGLWQYIKANKLQDTQDHRLIICNESLKSLLSVDTFTFPQITQLLHPHLSPVPPLEFIYDINLTQPFSSSSFAFDIEIDAEDSGPSTSANASTSANGNGPTSSVRAKMVHFLAQPGLVKEIARLDTLIEKYVERIYQHTLKRDFLSAFSADPCGFIQHWIEAQARDLDLVFSSTGSGSGAGMGSAGNREVVRRAEFWKEAWVGEAVWAYLTSVGRLDLVRKGQPVQVQAGQ